MIGVVVGGEGKVFGEKGGHKVKSVEWHPLSDTHLVVLSQKSRLLVFNLSSGGQIPEQVEYLLMCT